MDFQRLYQSPLYAEDLDYLVGLSLPYDRLRGASILISGASGMLGSLAVDALMHLNMRQDGRCRIYALGRSRAKLEQRFRHWLDAAPLWLRPVEHDLQQPLDDLPLPEKLDYVIHLASSTHPVAYATAPVETILANVIGTRHLLDCAAQHGNARFAFASSNEIYGENRGDTEFFDEKYCGYIDCNTLRAGYPESKRCGEALVQAYRRQCGLEAVIPRFTRSFGPTLLSSDTKALSQFLRNALLGQDIVLKSEGLQHYSYTYAADAVAGLLTILLKGQDGEAYNIAHPSCDVRLRDLAQAIARLAGTSVRFELPNAVERAGFSTATKARLQGDKVAALGWAPHWNLETGLRRTLAMRRECEPACL